MFSRPIPESNNYYTEFLKHIKEEKETIEKNNSTLFFTYSDFFTKNIVLEKFKINELKYLAKQHKLLVSGNKNELIKRITNYFKTHKACEHIQAIFRGHIVRYGIRLHGKGFPDYSKCVNDTEFYTLAPLSEIPFERFFSVEDDANFIYGFDILSLISMIKKTRTDIVNPYNREKFSKKILKNILSFYSILLILYPEYVILDIFSPAKDIDSIFSTINNNPISRRPTNLLTTNNLVLNSNVITQQPQSLMNRIQQWDVREQESRNIIREVREGKTVNYRISQLFHEIDTLGNYTSPYWLRHLDLESYKQLYETCYQWWRRPNTIPIHVKNAICGIHDLFSEIYTLRETDDREVAEEIVLNMFEVLIYTGIDIEHRKLGALHVLTMLTTVSNDARIALPWFYESIQ